MPARQDWRRAPGQRSRPSWATGRSSTGRRVVRRRASRPAGARPLPSVRAGLWIGPWASTLVGAEASFYSVVVKPGPLTAGDDLADVVITHPHGAEIGAPEDSFGGGHAKHCLLPWPHG